MSAMLLLEVSASAPTLPLVRRRSRAQGRARRWDAGPAPTSRDLAALRFVGEQYAVRADVAAVLLTRLSTNGPQVGGQLSRRAVREQLGRAPPTARKHLGHPDPGGAAPGRSGLRPLVANP